MPQMMSLLMTGAHPLQKDGEGTDETRIVAELKKLRLQQPLSRDLSSTLVRILGRTSSNRIRNAAALATVDCQIPGASDILLELLTRPDTQGARGTLLYALQVLGTKIPLNTLIDLIVTDTFESREEAGIFIRSGQYAASTSEVLVARQTLEAALPGADEERGRAITLALQYLPASRIKRRVSTRA
jgi:hypothetical protein